MGEVIITKMSGGLARQTPSQDGISGLCLMMPSIMGGAQQGQVYRLDSLEDAESLLITQNRDLSTDYLCHAHIADFFRISPKETLYIYIADHTLDYHLTIAPGIRALVAHTNGDVRQIACAYNGPIPADDSTATLAIAIAQTEANTAAANHSPIHVFTDGIMMDSTSVNLHTLNCPSVTVVAAQNLSSVNFDEGVGAIDPGVLQPWEYHTAVGLALGTVSSAAVNESIAWVDKFNLMGGSLNQAAIFGQSIVGKDTLLQTYIDKGYLVMRNHKGYAGIYWSGSPTCVALSSDFATIQNNRTIDKAIRLVRLAMLPFIESPLNVNPTTGQLAAPVVKNFENVCKRALDPMVKNNEFSGSTITIDPDQNILSTNQLELSISIIPTGTAETISVKLGFINPFN